MNIVLPRIATNDTLASLLEILSSADNAEKKIIDFGYVKFYKPGPIVAILSRLRHWHEQGKKLRIKNHQKCPAKKYLQRIDFFDKLGISLPEDFRRHSSGGKFVAIQVIDPSKVGELSRSISQCIAATTSSPYQVAECFSYALGEIITNVAQHSQGTGFVSAQSYPKEDLVTIAVADSGIGLRKSYLGTALEAQLDTPLKALQKSLEPEVSSALLRPLTSPYAKYVNLGIGLTMVAELTRQTYGHMNVISENALFSRTGDVSSRYQNLSGSHHGTLVTVSINTNEIDNFEKIITSVRNTIIPSKLDKWDDMFDS